MTMANGIKLKKWSHPLVLVFLLALLTRIAFIMTQQNGFYFPDSIGYSRTAVNLIASGGFGAGYDRAPGYPLFLASVYSVLGESIFAVRIVESFIGASLAVLIALIGNRIGDETIGLVAGGLWSVYPIAIFITGLIYPANLAAFLMALCVWSALPCQGKEFSATKLFAAGLFSGLAALTIPVVLLTIVALVAWIFFWTAHSRVWLAFLFLLGSSLTVLPWTVRNYAVYGRLVPLQSNVERHLPAMSTVRKNRDIGRLDAILERPDIFATHVIKNFLGFWELSPNRIRMADQDYRDRLHARHDKLVQSTIFTPNRLINAVSILSTGPVFLFAIIGTALVWIRKDRARELSLLYLVVLSFAVGYAFFVGRLRYRAPIEPYIIILSAYGISHVYSLLATRFPAGRQTRAETRGH
jgi:4-amino-4-deoxy-L-arabinose transferase-like glycosyltransferase